MKRTLIYFAALFAVPFTHAATVGSLFISSGGSAVSTLTDIDFTLDPTSVQPGFNAQVATSTHLSFLGCGGVLGSAGCLGTGEGVEINHGTPLGAGTVLPESGFMTFALNGSTHDALDFTLLGVVPGASTDNCAGLAQFQSCSAYVGSPVVLTKTGVNTTASLSLFGTATDGTSSVPWVGSFSSTFPGLNPGQVQRIFCPSGTCTPADFAAGTSTTTAFSGAVIAIQTTPEPGSLTLMLGGGAILGLAAARRRRKF